MAKTAKEAPAEAEGAAKPNSKKKLLIIVGGVVLLAIAGGAGWYFTKGSHPAEAAKAPPPAPPKFMPIEAFTVNLQHEGGDQFLQLGVTLKYSAPELEEKIKLHMPEIRSRLIFLLSSKHASDLTPLEGKKKLAKEMIADINSVLGINAAPPAKPPVHESHAAPAEGAAPEGESAPVETASAAEETAPPPAPAAAHGEKAAGVLDVLFTSFIIQ